MSNLWSWVLFVGTMFEDLSMSVLQLMSCPREHSLQRLRTMRCGPGQACGKDNDANSSFR
jgi:hypothetical protein